MNEEWKNCVEYLKKELFPNLKDFKRDNPFACYGVLRPYLVEYTGLYGKSYKSLEISQIYLNRGDELSKSIHDRISCFTQSIFYAPTNSSILIIAYLKRSELLNEAGHKWESKNDCAMAFQCYLDNFEKPQQRDLHPNVKVMEKFLKETSRKIFVSQEEHTNVEHEMMRILQRGVAPYDDWHLPALKYGENINFPSSSKALRVDFSQEKGRYVVANSDIKMGDVLFVEEPLAHVVHKSSCSYCCQTRFIYFPCTYCSEVQYCCKGCRDEDWISYHKYECGFVEFLQQTGIGYLAFRTFLKSGCNIDKLRDLTNELKAKETCGSTEFSKIKYENVYNLLNHSKRIGTSDYLRYSLTALLLSFYLIHHTRYAEETEENIRFCAEILLRHIIQLVTNAHTITATEKDMDKSLEIISQKQVQIGSGIYPSVSIMNHSCEPSVFIFFYKYYMIVKAKKDIKKGEEVFDSYGIDCRRMRRGDRQEMLRDQYLFDCKCKPCLEKYDRYDILNSLKCPNCKGPLLKESESEVGVCIICFKRQIIPEKMSSVEFILEKLLKYGEYLDEANISMTWETLLKGWVFSRECLFAFHKDISYLAKKIAFCLFRLNYLKDCIKVLSYNMTCVKGRFGPYSSELAMEAKILRDVINYYQETKIEPEASPLTFKEKESCYMCDKILRSFYGDDHPIVREVTNNSLL